MTQEYYGLNPIEWEKARRDLRSILMGHASRGKLRFYSEIVEELGVAKFDAHHPGFHKMLGDISVYEHEHRRPLLSALVVTAEESMPGKGFFILAEELGSKRPKEDTLTYFARETGELFKYWKTALETPAYDKLDDEWIMSVNKDFDRLSKQWIKSYRDGINTKDDIMDAVRRLAKFRGDNAVIGQIEDKLK